MKGLLTEGLSPFSYVSIHFLEVRGMIYVLHGNTRMKVRLWALVVFMRTQDIPHTNKLSTEQLAVNKTGNAQR